MYRKFNEIENIEKMDALSRWLEFLIEPKSSTARQLELSDETIKQAKTELYRLSMDSKDREKDII